MPAVSTVEHPAVPRRLADLRVGLRLVEAATGTVWEVVRIRRANTYATPWVHLLGAGGTPRVEGAGALIFDPGDDPFPAVRPAWTVERADPGPGARRRS